MIINKRYIVLFSIVTLLSSLLFQAGCGKPGPDEPDVNVYTFPHGTEEPSAQSPQTQQPGDQPPSSSTADSTNEYNERSIVVDDHNNVFPIGIPAGYTEKREIKAEKPVDIWFEYLPQEVELEVDGEKVQRSSDRWEFKINYISGVTEFNYIARNTSSQYLSYNLYITPAQHGASIAVVVKEWWTP
jgi:hypothetical protein